MIDPNKLQYFTMTSMTPQQIDAMKLALGALEDSPMSRKNKDAIDALRDALAEHAMQEVQRLGQEIEQEPVAMRMPKVGDEVVCNEDDSLAEVAYLTVGGSPEWCYFIEIKFDDGSHGTYLLREFAELFRYATPPQRKPLTDEEMKKIWYAMQNIMGWYSFQEIARAIEAAHGIRENT